jgi:hypothetical protein
MPKYLKLLLLSALSSGLFSTSINAKEIDSEQTEEEEDQEIVNQLTLPSVVPSTISSGIESNTLIQLSSSGINSSAAAALGTANLRLITSKLSGTAAERSAQLKTYVDVIDAYSNADNTQRSGRRAINSTADLSTIVNSTVTNLSADHITTLGALSVENMGTFASDGIANIDNFTTRVDVTSAMLGTSISLINTTNLDSVISNLHSSLDGDSLTALKSLEKSHMTTLVGSGDKKIDLTASFDASIIKGSVKKFATKAEVTVTFAKKTGGDNLSGIDLGAIATQIHSSLDDDHLNALQNLSVEHMDAMMPDASTLANGLDVSHIAHVATKAEVVLEFAKASAGTTKLNDDGTINFGTSFTTANMKDFVTTVHTHITEDMTKSIALYDPEHMNTLVPTGGTMDQSELEHFGTKAQVGATYFKADMTEAERRATALSVSAKVNTMDKDMTTSFKKIVDHSSDMNFADIVGTVSIENIHHAGAKAKKTSTFIDSGASVAELKQLATNLEADVEHLETLAIMDQTSLVSTYTGVSITDATSDENKHKADVVHYSGVDPAKLGEYTPDMLKALAESTDEEKAALKSGDKDPKDHANEKHIAGTKNSDNADIDTAVKAVKLDAKAIGAAYDTLAGVGGFQAALESSIKVAESILTDRTISNNAQLGTNVNADSLASNGYNAELIRILAKYGALGSKGSTLSEAVLGADFKAFDRSINLRDKLQPNTSSYQQFLTELGARALNADKTGNDIFSVKTSNINLSPGANITFNASSEIDYSNILPKGDRRIAVIGAAKDMTFKGNLNIKNLNTEENGVLVLGAASDLYFRSADNSPTASADYEGNPNVVSITNEGANLALGSEKSMQLVNVSIKTGGNLAIGTLKDLKIGTSTAQQNTLSVGNNQNSDPDNLYLYAHNLIQVNGLEITGRVDDVYMEAITINLRNVTFPSTAEVTLRSRDGLLNTGSSTFSNPTPGYVNMENVKHKGILNDAATPAPVALDKLTHFHDGGAGKIYSKVTLPNGTPAIQVKKF